MSRSILIRLRGYFLAGLALTASLGITVYATWFIISLMNDFIINLIPPVYRAEVSALPGIGFIGAIIFLTVVGWLAASLLGRFFVRLGERIIAYMPVVRSIYGGAKQVFDTIFARKSYVFRRAVLINFPHEKSWAIGFLTQRPPRAVRDELTDDVYAVFMPTAPNPTTGYLMYIPKEKVRLLDISVEDAFKMIVSGGLILPDEK